LNICGKSVQQALLLVNGRRRDIIFNSGGGGMGGESYQSMASAKQLSHAEKK